MMRLKDVATVRVSNVDKKSYDGERSVRLCNYTDVYYGESLRADTSDFMEATASVEQLRNFRLFPGDTVLTKDSETADDIGVSAYVEQSADDFVCGYHLAILRPDTRSVHPKFLFWLTRATTFREQLSVAATGVTRFGLRAEELSNTRICLPPLEEQGRIADFLDAEMRQIATVERRRQRQFALLDERSLAEISECIAPGILARPLGKSPMSWLPRLPSDIPLVRLGYVCRLQTGLTVDGARDLNGDVVTRPYLRVANVQAGHIRLDSVTEIAVPRAIADRSTLRRGDVLMTEGGDLDKLGRGAIWRGELADCLHQNHIFALRTDEKQLYGEYLALATQSLHGRCYFESTGVKTTNLASTNSSKILAFPVPLPSLDQQRVKVSAMRRSLDSTERARSLIDKQVMRLRERRQALITGAVMGQIDVTTARGVDV